MTNPSPPTQVFVRNREGKVWGPIEPQSVQLLMEGGLLEAPVEVSLNGIDFSPPDLIPEFSDAVPKAIWSGAAANKPKFVPPVLKPVNDATPQRHSAGTGAAPPPPPIRPAAAPAPANPPTLTPSIAPAPVASAGSRAPSNEDIPREGQLSSSSAIRLYGLAATTDASGLFVFFLGDRTLEVHFRKGNPERVESSHPDDALSVFLRQQGLATEERLAEAEHEKGRFGGELVATLFGLGILNPATAFAQLGQRAQQLLLQAFHATSGRFTFEPKELPAHQAMPLGNRWSVLSEVTRRLPLVEIVRRLHDEFNCPVVRSNGRVSTNDLRLTAVESRAFARVDGVRSLEELVRDFPVEAETFQRLVFLLRELEVVAFAIPTAGVHPAPAPPPEVAPAPKAAPPAAKKTAKAPTAPKSAPKPPAPATPTPRAAPVPPVPTLSPEAEIKELRVRVAALKEQNHLQVLGLSESVDSNAVKAAYFRLAKQFHPDTVSPDAPPDLGKLKADVFAAIGEAYRVLGEDGSRAQYLSDLKSGGLDKVDVQAIFAAEEKFQRACVVFKSRRYSEALQMFEECIAANPEEGEFYAWRGYAKFVVALDKKKVLGEAQKDLQDALKRNPRCAPAHYFLGMIAKVGGDPSAARRHFQSASDLDAQHVDAQRELRMLSK